MEGTSFKQLFKSFPYLHSNWMFYKRSPFPKIPFNLKENGNYLTVTGLQQHCMTLRLIAGL